MIKAMQCRAGIWRVEDGETGRVEIYDTYGELTSSYRVIGVLTPSIGLTYIVERR